MAPETQQMAEISAANSGRTARAKARMKQERSITIADPNIVLEDLRALVAETDTWPAHSTVTVKTGPGYPGEAPEYPSITVRST